MFWVGIWCQTKLRPVRKCQVFVDHDRSSHAERQAYPCELHGRFLSKNSPMHWEGCHLISFPTPNPGLCRCLLVNIHQGHVLGWSLVHSTAGSFSVAGGAWPLPDLGSREVNEKKYEHEFFFFYIISYFLLLFRLITALSFRLPQFWILKLFGMSCLHVVFLWRRLRFEAAPIDSVSEGVKDGVGELTETFSWRGLWKMIKMNFPLEWLQGEWSLHNFNPSCRIHPFWKVALARP